MAQVKKDNNVSVGVRVRPRNEKEVHAAMPVFFRKSADGSSVEELDENGVTMKHWPYDYVFGNDSTNEEIFNSVGARLVDASLEGYNTVIFLYGQTSSGKTFTLFGDPGTAGVVHHAMEYVHRKVQSSTDMEFVIRINYAELYNEELKDLLAPNSTKPLKIIEDPHVGPMIQGITEANFTSAGDVRVLLEEGEQRRHFGETNMNAHSSRSHVIVRLHIESRRVAVKSANPLRTSWGKDRPNCVATLNLVDLAGSERANKAGTSGETLKEGSYINKSLLTLGTVIANLSEGKLQHIPYRNSKLTRLLATALGGNAKTCMITCISPASGNLAESLNTLRFATRAKRIVNHVQKNEILDMKSLTGKLTQQAAELEYLRQQLELSRQLGFNPDDEDMGDSLREKALNSGKKWRSMKFMLQFGPRILTGLRGNGMSNLAKTVLQNMRSTLSGKKDAHEVIEELSTVVSTYLSKDRVLLQKIHDLETQNESDVLPAADEDLHEDPMELGQPTADDDIFQMLERGGEEVREQLENASFDTENIRGLALIHIAKLQKRLRESEEAGRQLHRTNDEHLHHILEHRETIKTLRISEHGYQKQVEDLKAQLASESAAYSEQIRQLNAKLGLMESLTSDRDSSLAERNQLLMMKEGENEQLRSQLDRLQEDLMAALASKKSVEDELVRSRTDDRAKLEKLRNNMHELLVNQGDTGKKIEMLTKENGELQTKLQVMEDELDALIKMTDQLNLEIVQLRGTVSSLRDSEKIHVEKKTAMQEENADLSMKIRDMRLEITRLMTTVSMNEQQHLQSKQQLDIRLSEGEQLLASKEAQLKMMKEKYEARLSELQVDNSIKEAEIESLREQLTAKQAFLAKIEQTFGADVSRLEKKLAAQGKLCEELQRENTNTAIQIHQIHFKHGEEVRALKSKISELQSTIDGIQAYVDRQEKELIEAQQQDLFDDDVSYYNSPYYDNSPFSRRNSGMSSAPSSANLTRKESYVSQFYFNSDTPVGRGSFYSRGGSFFSPGSRPGSLLSPAAAGRDSLLGDDVDVTLIDDLDENDDDDGRHGTTSAASAATTSTTSAALQLPPASREKGGRRSVAFKDPSPESGHDTQARTKLTATLDALLAPLQELYEGVQEGFELSTMLMEANITEDRSLREELIKARLELDMHVYEGRVQLERLQDEADFLRGTKEQTHDSLVFSERKNEQLQSRCRQLEENHERMSSDYHRAMSMEKLHKMKIEQLEQQNKELKTKIDVVRLDLQRQQQSHAELRLENLKLSGSIEEFDEKLAASATRLVLAKQEISVLSAEKDELVRRYLPGLASRQP